MENNFDLGKFNLLISNKVNLYFRKKYIKKVLGKFGKVEEESDKFICYISKLKNNSYCKMIRLELLGLDLDKETAKKLDLDKEICYVFSNITFDAVMDFHTNSKLIFKNCIFNNNVYINSSNDVILENSKFYNKYNTVYIDCLSILAKRLEFTDTNISFNSYCRCGVNINTDDLQIKNSDFYVAGDIDLYSKKSIFKDSKIKSKYINLVSGDIDCINSFFSNDEVYIENKKYNFNGNIEFSYMKYNTIQIDGNNNGYVKIDNEKVKLINARKNLVNSLRKIKRGCEKENSEKLKIINENLNKQNVGKVLKKKIDI